MRKQTFVGMALTFAGLLVLLTKLIGNVSDRQADDQILFSIGGTGESIQQTPTTEGEGYYHVSFYNNTGRSFRIQSVEPVLTKDAQALVTGEVKPAEEEKRIESGGQIEYQGTFRIDTSRLSEEQIKQLIPMVEGYRVRFNNHEEVILPVKNPGR